MIIDWTYGTYLQISNYFNIGYVESFSAYIASATWTEIVIRGIDQHSGKPILIRGYYKLP